MPAAAEIEIVGPIPAVAEGVLTDAALELARQIAAFPQRCMRADRLSSYRQWELSLDEALRAHAPGASVPW